MPGEAATTTPSTTTSPAPAAGGAPAAGAAASSSAPAGAAGSSAPAPAAAAVSAAGAGSTDGQPAAAAGAGQGEAKFWGGQPVKLELPKDVTLPADRLSALEKHITEQKLSPEQVKPFLDLLPGYREALKQDDAKAASDQHQKLVGEWHQAASSDKQSIADAKVVFERFSKAHPNEAKSLGEFWDKTGIGWQPANFKLLAFIGKTLREAMSEDNSQVPSATGKPAGPLDDSQKPSVLFDHPQSKAYRQVG